jgi:redox-sensitive bicupin YhaK (pirin superfamily)
MTKNKQAQEDHNIKKDAVATDSEINKIQMTRRSTSRVLNSVKTMEGEGLVVNRSLPNNREFDPFLLLDEFGPLELAPGKVGGVPAHPHRGFETVTYMLDGRFEHEDSQGHSGKLNPGDVQWMTAGSGIVHSEMPEKEFARTGGRLHGFQLWVNLPKGDKMVEPRYQEIPSSLIPVAKKSDGRVTVKIIAGEALGNRAVIDTRTPIMYLHFILQPNGEIVQHVPKDYNAFAYVINGVGYFGKNEQSAQRGQMVIFARDGEELSIRAPADATTSPLDVLLLAGVPLKEPIVQYGPFVMNTSEEIYQAIEDFRSGKIGRSAQL